MIGKYLSLFFKFALDVELFFILKSQSVSNMDEHVLFFKQFTFNTQANQMIDWQMIFLYLVGYIAWNIK